MTARDDDRGIWGACGGIHVEAPTFTAEELDYMAWLNAESAAIDESLLKFNDLAEIIGAEQIFDPVWRAEIEAVFATWDAAYQAAEARVTPADFGRLHQLYIDGLWHFGMAADYMSTYFATFDLGSWDLAVEELVLAEVSILEYLKEYARIYSERGSPFPGITILA